MKLCKWMVALVAVWLLSGCETTPASPGPETAAASGNVVVYEVFGMDCPGCHGGLEKNMEKVPGVVEASANWKEQTVTLVLEDAGSLDAAAIAQAVEDSNFTLGEKISPE